MLITRRECLATLGAASVCALGGRLYALPYPKEIIITYRLDNLLHREVFDFSNVKTKDDIYQLYKKLWHGLYFKNGNAQGVYEKVEYQGKEVCFNATDKAHWPTIYRNRYKEENFYEFEVKINNRYDLRMNRYGLCFDDNVKKFVFVGLLEHNPPNKNGTEWFDGRKIRYN